MRNQLNKLQKNKSTKSERRFSELLKELRIPFRTKVKIRGREIDFLVGNYAIEIDAHGQDVLKNQLLIEEGYNPVHFPNHSLKNSKEIKKWLLQLTEQIYSHQASTRTS